MWELLLPKIKSIALWACIVLWCAFLGLLVVFSQYRLNVAKERLQAVTRELTATTNELERFQLEQVRLGEINTQAATKVATSKERTTDASTQTNTVGSTRFTDAEYNILYKRASEVRTAATGNTGRTATAHSASSAP